MKSPVKALNSRGGGFAENGEAGMATLNPYSLKEWALDGTRPPKDVLAVAKTWRAVVDAAGIEPATLRV